MKRYLSGLFLLMVLPLQAQLSDTVWVNQHHTVTLVFPQAVSLADAGHAKFLISINGQVVLLKATAATSLCTNLLVRYGTDQYFMGYIGYAKQLPALYYDYRSPAVAAPPASGTSDSSQMLNPAEMQERLRRFLELPKDITGHKSTKNQMGIYLEGIRNGPQCTYVRLKLSNTSTLPYHIQDLSVHYRAVHKKRSLEDVVSTCPFIAHNIPTQVPPKSTVQVGLAFQHIGVSQRGKLEILLSERGGNRPIKLSVKGIHLLNAFILQP